jgi:hypothetical protein
VGPIRMELDIYNKIIVVKTTRECINIFKTLKPILIEAWECDEKKIINYSETECLIYYDIDILEKYLDTIIILN